MKEIVSEKALILNVKKLVSKNGKDYFKAEINDSDLGVLSCFVPVELFAKLKEGENRDVVFKVDKDRFNSPILKLSDVR